MIIRLLCELRITESLADIQSACSVYTPLIFCSALSLFTILKAVLKHVIHLIDLRTYIFLIYCVMLSGKNPEDTLLLIMSTEV